jgi:ribosomal protein S18 acetylase RimI-like enzyme
VATKAATRAFHAPTHRLRPEGLFLRAIGTDDLPFLSELYACGRAAELAPVPWSAQQKRDFLQQQFDLQHAYYEKNYPGADRWLIGLDDQRIGRIYIYRSANDIRVMDIALMPDYQRRGIGSALLRELIEEADAMAVTITLHVEADNPAVALYRRLGFEHLEDRGVYQFLGRHPRSPSG